MSVATEFRIDPSWYWSAERAEQEWDKVWTRVWQMGPREEELPEAGDTFVHTFGRESLLFIRGRDGAIHGYYNVCRHRGNRLLLGGDGPAFVNNLTCAFHGWEYDLDGALQNVPYEERFEKSVISDPECTSLRSFSTDRFGGWIWFTLDDDAPPLRQFLGPLATRLEAYQMQRASIVDYKTFDFACNWKTVSDAFNESYHFQSLHPEVLSWGSEDAPITMQGIHSFMVNKYGKPSKLYADQETLNPQLKALLEASGIDPDTFDGTASDVREAIQQAKRKQEDSEVFPYATLSDSQLTDAYHYQVFPSVHFNLFPEFYVAMRYRPHPGGDPQRMYFDFIMCAPLAADEPAPTYEHRIVQGGAEPVSDVLDWGIRAHPVVNQVLEQDVHLVEHVQRGMRSQGFAQPILSADEKRIAHMNENIDALIRGERLEELIARSPVETEGPEL